MTNSSRCFSWAKPSIAKLLLLLLLQLLWLLKLLLLLDVKFKFLWSQDFSRPTQTSSSFFFSLKKPQVFLRKKEKFESKTFYRPLFFMGLERSESGRGRFDETILPTFVVIVLKSISARVWTQYRFSHQMQQVQNIELKKIVLTLLKKFQSGSPKISAQDN